MINSKGMSHTLFVGCLLALTGGFLDVYTYVCRGGVFANAQTGNLVLLGIKLVEGEFVQAFFYVIPVIAFVIGVIISDAVRMRFLNIDKFHWRHIIILVEILALIVAGIIPQNRANNMIINIIISFICSLQVQSFRIINGNILATTMCTGNLRSTAELIFKYSKEKNPQQKRSIITYLSVLICFVLGAVIGAIFCYLINNRAIFVPSVFLIVVFIVMFIGTNQKRKIKKD